MFILLSGKDEFSANEELTRLRASDDFGYNQDTFAGEVADLAAIRNTCDTMPFLSEKRLVVVEGLPKPPKRKGGAEDGDEEEDVGEDADKDRLSRQSRRQGKRGKKAATTGLTPLAFAKGIADIVPSLPETTTLIVLVPDELKADSPLMQAARRHGKSHVFTKPSGTQLDDWVIRRARTQKRRVTPEAARMLVESLGDNLRMLAGEIDKLGTYVGEGREIGAGGCSCADTHRAAVEGLRFDRCARSARYRDRTRTAARTAGSGRISARHRRVDGIPDARADAGEATLRSRHARPSDCRDGGSRAIRRRQVITAGAPLHLRANSRPRTARCWRSIRRSSAAA